MKDLGLDLGGDLSFDDGGLSIIEGTDVIRQRLLIRLKTFMGEWFLDVKFGTPYYQYILGNSFLNMVVINAAFVSTILSCPGIIKLNDDIDYSIDDESRELTVSFSCLTSTDEIVSITEVF